MLTRIVNGRIWKDGNILEKDILIEDEKILDLIRKGQKVQVDRILDAKGALILPGLVDAHTHLRDSRISYKEDFVSGTSAAVAGGFTVVLDMPNTEPPITSPERLEDRIASARKKILCDVGFYAMPLYMDKIEDLVRTGCIGFKIYTHKSFEEINFFEDETIDKLFKAVEKTGLTLSIHAEDPSKIGYLGEKYNAIEHARAHSIEAEVNMIKRILNLAKKYNLKIRFCHISTAEGIKIVAGEKRYSLNYFTEVTPAHLTLDESILHKYDKICVVEPPIRGKEDVIFLRKMFWNGVIDIIGTDHAPHTLDEKLCDRPAPGFPGLETAVPVLFTLAKKGFIPFSKLIESLTSNPARIFNLNGYGAIDKDNVSNLTFLKFVPEYEIDSSKFYSKAKFTPFKGFKAETIVTRTIVRGETVYDRESGVIDERRGKVIKH
ncbi:MAG: dihydroorotase family protein [Nitrososphaeria archaeon]|nr:dihydroorotase family protein [Nitrososphaeria archaeon]